MNTAPSVTAPKVSSDRLLTEYQLQQQGRLVSIAMPATEVTPAAFLRYAQGKARFFWRDGQTGITFVGMGTAVDLMAWGETRFQGIERQARELFANALLLPTVGSAMDPLALPRLFGGFAFREDFVPDFAWHGFHPAHFILPHYQLVHHDEQCWLTLNTLFPADEDPTATAPQLQAALAHFHRELTALSAFEPAADPPQPARAPTLSYPMPQATWSAMIEAAQARFATGDLEKVVLARVCEVQQSAAVDLHAALTYLQQHYPACYTFLFEPQPNHAFFGATPELLVATSGKQVTTMGLAGSIQRGATAAEDAALATKLLNSAKDRHEHELVVAALRRRLAPLVDELTIPAEPAIYQLSNIQHLYTPMQARLQQPMGILPLVDLLHPTPALGGAPRARSLQFISEFESVPRGWYAGPIGWIDQQLDGAFGVAIRSAVAQSKRVWLYAGAGIVAASVPEQEWIETGWKFKPIQAALGVGE